MESRFDASLRAGFDSGALGFTRDGLVVVRDAAKLQLKDRVAVNQAVADDNRDRKAVYREVAVANGHAGVGIADPRGLRQAVDRQRPQRLVVPGRLGRLEAEVGATSACNGPPRRAVHVSGSAKSCCDDVVSSPQVSPSARGGAL